MALPALLKTWQFRNNLVSPIGSSLTDCSRQLIWNIKQSLIGEGSWTKSDGSATTVQNAWTVVGSSNSASAGMDGVDRWSDPSGLVWNSSGARSWIVLGQNNVNAPFHILIDLNGSNTVNPRPTSFLVSPTGFGAAFGGSDGAVDVRPTATVSHTLASASGTTLGLPSSSAAHRVHTQISNDGKCTRVVFCRNGQSTGFWMFEAPGSFVTGWTTPYVAMIQGVSTAAPTSSLPTTSDLTSTSSPPAYGYGVSEMRPVFSVEGFGTSPYSLNRALTGVNDFSGERPIFPVGLFSLTSGNTGRHGVMADLWFGQDNLAGGSSYPTSAPLHQFVQFGGLILPWDRSVPDLGA